MSIKETIADSTDPGTLRPDIPPTTAVGTQFMPLDCPQFDFKISLPLHVAPNDAFAIWSLFFPLNQLESIVNHTNDYIKQHQAQGPRTKGARVVQPVTIAELYGYMGIWIYMGLHVENEVRAYWSTSEQMPRHTLVAQIMSKNRWEDIHRLLHLSGPDAHDVFDKV
jgi:hypothetical protein